MKSAHVHTFFAAVVLAIAALASVGCGNKIGDSCRISSDCATEGGRICDTESPGGYCTITSCDVDSCPGESECVRFFSMIHLDKPCAGPDDCSLDEICTSGGQCAQRASERRACMLRCDGTGDCRDGYECRDAERRAAHGGEPLRPEGATGEPPAFCAAALPCSTNEDCDLGDVCAGGTPGTLTGRCRKP